MKKICLLMLGVTLIIACGVDNTNRVLTGAGVNEIEYQDGYGAIRLAIKKDSLQKPAQLNKIPNNTSSIEIRIWNASGYDKTTKVRLDNEGAADKVIQIPAGEEYHLDALAYEYLQYINNEGKSLLTAGRSQAFNIEDKKLTTVSLELSPFQVDFSETDTIVNSGQPITIHVTISGPNIFNILGDTVVLTAMRAPWSKDGGYLDFKRSEYAIQKIISISDQALVEHDDGSATLSITSVASAPQVDTSTPETLYYQIAIGVKEKPILYIPSISSQENLEKLTVNPASGIAISLS